VRRGEAVRAGEQVGDLVALWELEPGTKLPGRRQVSAHYENRRHGRAGYRVPAQRLGSRVASQAPLEQIFLYGGIDNEEVLRGLGAISGRLLGVGSGAGSWAPR